MVELLAAEKHRLLAAEGHVTRNDFRRAWLMAWDVMVLERAWPHASRHRRMWREAMVAMRPEMEAAFLDAETPFSAAAGKLSSAAARMCLQLEPEQVGRALLAAMTYVDLPADDESLSRRASNAAYKFVNRSAEAA